MKKTYIHNMLSLGLILLANNTLANNLTVGNKSTATLAGSCQIKAQSISFGILSLPLTTQSATSNLSVLCSKEATYKIDMAFGLSTNYWSIRVSGGAYADATWRAETALYDSSGKLITTSSFYYKQGLNPTTLLPSAMNCTMTADDKCHPTATSANNGVMIGAKDSVAYTIFIPGDTSKVWNMGKNSYTGTGTGNNQTIPVLAQIVPSASSAYPAPDMYSDNVVATITY